VVKQCPLIFNKRVLGKKVLRHPVRMGADKYSRVLHGKLFRGLRVVDDLNNPVHMQKELRQCGALLGREALPILLNVPPNVRKPALVLGNAMGKNIKGEVVNSHADFDEVVAQLLNDLRGAAHCKKLVMDPAKHLKD